jgi:hypothetical protein
MLLQFKLVLPSSKDTGIWQGKGLLVGGLETVYAAVLRSVGDEAAGDMAGFVARPSGGQVSMVVMNVAALSAEKARRSLSDGLTLLCFHDALAGAALYSAVGQYVSACLPDGEAVLQQMEDEASHLCLFETVLYLCLPVFQPAFIDSLCVGLQLKQLPLNMPPMCCPTLPLLLQGCMRFQVLEFDFHGTTADSEHAVVRRWVHAPTQSALVLHICCVCGSVVRVVQACRCRSSC